MTRTRSRTFFGHFRRASRRGKGVVAVVLALATGSAGLQAQGPSGGVVRAGEAAITGEGTATTRIEQFTDRAVIDWRTFGVGAADQVVFVQPSAQSATLNRVTGDQVSVLLGRLDANGQVLLINPNGIVFGQGAQVNVGSLIASTANVGTANFMAGRLVFDEPGKPGAGIVNGGRMTASDGGLVALVAPHVRNDGIIVARLGRVVLGSADTFTVDLYGDALINLALSDASAGRLVTADGRPVSSLITNSGAIETAGGETVLMTARGAKSVLDDLINMSGTIRADAAVQQGGRILLLGEGGRVEVGGTLSATGGSGGSIAVSGDSVHLSASAVVDASGTHAGGGVEVGGGYQGGGDLYRARRTVVEQGATLAANAVEQGQGGDVVVWADDRTEFAGRVEARGGAGGGDGGRLEVSGKGSLAFVGQADASAAGGQGGTLLLDPATIDVGAAEAGAITRVLRTGTSTTLAADADINVNAAIYGGDRLAGGGLTMTAGRDINVGDFVVTNNGAITLNAVNGAVSVAPGKALFAGTAPITVNALGTMHTAPLVTGGALSVRSLAGSVVVDSFIDGHAGPISIRAAGSVDIDQPIVNFAAGDALSVTAGDDINVNAQVDGRGGVAGGQVSMTAGQNLRVNQAVVSNDGAVSLTATNGTLTVAPDAAIVAGAGAVALSARGDVTSGPTSGSALTITSSAGTVAVNGLVDAATGDTRITAASDVNINQAIVNGQSGRSLTVSAGRDVNVNALVDGRGGAGGGAVTLQAGRSVTVNESLLTNNGAITLNAASGSAAVASGRALVSGSGAITVRAAGDVATGAVSGGSLSASSSAGSVRVTGGIDGATGRVELNAAGDVIVGQPVANLRTGSAFTATAGRDVVVDAPIDGRNGAVGGTVALNAGRDVSINAPIVTNNGAVTVAAATGAARMAAGTALAAGAAPIAVTAAGDVTTAGISAGSLSVTSTGGSVSVQGVVDGNTGRVDLRAARDLTIDQPLLSPRSGGSLTATAGGALTVNAPIDGAAGAKGGAVSLTAGQDLTVNAGIATNDAAITLSSSRGATSVAASATLVSGAGAIALDALGPVTTGTLSGGAMTVTSRGGGISLTGPLSGTGGALTIAAARQVDIAHAITNPGSGSPLTVTAGTTINVSAPIDGRAATGPSSGTVVLTAGQDVHLADSVTTKNASISVTAQNGAVTTATGEGLFAGSGPISVQSAQTLSTGITSTTGALTLRSTAGDVNVNQAISGETGAVTIAAGNDVHVNQAIANPRSDAPLSITAGRDLVVDAVIDGRDNVLAGPGGSLTLHAGRDLTVNDDLVARDSALTLSADAGTLTVGPGKALFAGSGPIALTSGATLSTPELATTGRVDLRSTGGAVNVDHILPDTMGAVSITAATAVNVNQTITNLVAGSNLTVVAGSDINVLSPIDGRSGTVTGGAVTMTAGQNIDLAAFVATNDGAVNLTATGGTITTPQGTETSSTPMQWIVSSGSAPVSLTAGSSLALRSPIVTTGALALTSTGGSVTIAAPITDVTGAVTISGGNAVIVDHQVKSNNQPITLNAGAGGITINVITDYDQTFESPVNSGTANLTFNSVGDVSVLDSRGISSAATVTIDTRGRILGGRIGYSSTSPSDTRPQTVLLNADNGMTFDLGRVGQATATSSGGSIDLAVSVATTLRATTGTPGTTDCPTCDIHIQSVSADLGIGPDVVLNAGGSINMSPFRSTVADFTARSGDINLDFALMDGTLTGVAGRDVNLSNTIWMAGGPLSLTAGRDVVTTSSSPIHIGYVQPLTLSAGRNLTLFLLEALGAVSLTATTGSMTLNNDIGPHIVNNTTSPDFNPDDKGVASLTIAAPAATATITMQGARAEGDVTITTGGTLTAAKQITSVNGQVTIAAAGGATLSNTPIGDQEQLPGPGFVSPVASPGPKAGLPTPPGLVSNGGPGVPAFAEIPVSAADQNNFGAITPVSASGAVIVPGAASIAAAAGRATGLTGRPAPPQGGGPAVASGSSDPGTADTAAALRQAGESCGEQSASDDETGLAALSPGKAVEAATGNPASCPPPEAADQAGAAAGQVPPAPPTAPAAPTGGGQ